MPNLHSLPDTYCCVHIEANSAVFLGSIIGPYQLSASGLKFCVTCRYRRLYNAAIKDRAVTYAWFFIAYLIHIAFCIWSAVSPPLPGANDWSHTGFIACIKAFDASKFVGVLYTIGGVLWALESLWSFWVLKVVRQILPDVLCMRFNEHQMLSY